MIGYQIFRQLLSPEGIDASPETLVWELLLGAEADLNGPPVSWRPDTCACFGWGRPAFRM